MQTTARQTPDGFVVNGRKRWITNSPVADWVTVLCRSGTGLTMLAVDLKHSPGVRIGTPDLKMGHRGQLTADIVFDEVVVPAANVLGQPGNGLSVALATLTYGRIGIAAAGVGVAQAALDLAVDRLRTRKVFGKPLGAMQHWQYRLAERATEVECARSLY
jgi:alkylation response protein AidB-like acyl-CoA dehydrogenase